MSAISGPRPARWDNGDPAHESSAVGNSFRPVVWQVNRDWPVVLATGRCAVLAHRVSLAETGVR
jgi:hypothetical protein